MFVRVLVDDQPAGPGDVVFVADEFTGTRSFTFVQRDVAVGEHTVRAQWRVELGGEALIGDRTMTLQVSPRQLTEQEGGLTVTAARGGRVAREESPYFEPIPGLAGRIWTPANGNLAITVSGEAFTIPGSNPRDSKSSTPTAAPPMIFVRVVEPSGRPPLHFFGMGSFTGARSVTFVRDKLAANSSTARAEWQVFPTNGFITGGIGFMRDRTLAAFSLQGQVPDLAEPFFGFKPTFGPRKVLAILWDPPRLGVTRPKREDIRKLLYGQQDGSQPNVADYFRENSGGRFWIEEAETREWLTAAQPDDFYARTGAFDPANLPVGDPHRLVQDDEVYYLDDAGFISGHAHKYAEAVRRTSAAGFDFGAYDTNGDGILEADELSILLVIPSLDANGFVRPLLGQEFPERKPLVVNGIQLTDIVEAYLPGDARALLTTPPSLGVTAHELTHNLLGTPDMYFWFFHPYAAGAYSLMDQHGHHPHLDPFLKMRLGWVAPEIVTASRKRTSRDYTLRDAATHSEAIVLYDPDRGGREYFIVENRWRKDSPEPSYDRYLPDSGLAIWHIIENPAFFGTLPAPDKVDATEWAKVGAHDWGRRAIRMIRPVYGPPFDDTQALWHSPVYDLASDDSNPDHATLKWIDGSASGFAIRNFSSPGAEMTVTIEFDPDNRWSPEPNPEPEPDPSPEPEPDPSPGPEPEPQPDWSP
jgi:M6 family metalloprotease-like protein